MERLFVIVAPLSPLGYSTIMAKVAVTGTTGLAGNHVARKVREAGHEVVGISRGTATDRDGKPLWIVPDLADAAALANALEGCDTVFHFADRADRKSYQEQDVKAAATIMTALRTAATRCGIRRIVAASSVYADRIDRPSDLYGRSKRGMEKTAVAPVPGAPALILRLPPLYGPGARGAVRHIARAADNGWPLPFALARAPRRFLSLDMLADLCLHLVQVDDTTFERAAGRILVPVDVTSGSLAALSQTLARGKAALIPLPGVDRLIGGRVAPGQLERDHRALIDTVGWQAHS